MGGKPTVLMLFDIDHFKRINDTHGHAAGDDALRTVARCARETLRTRDVLGRIGGDEFMLLLPGASVDHALQIADRITRRLDAQGEITRLPLSLSFGVVQVEIGETIESARRRADAALYEAKRQGRRRAVPAELRGRDTVFGESRPLGLDPLQPV
jgi:diguanylate cyclase